MMFFLECVQVSNLYIYIFFLNSAGATIYIYIYISSIVALIPVIFNQLRNVWTKIVLYYFDLYILIMFP